MAKIEKEVQKFVKSYKLKDQIYWKVVIPDGNSGQIRKQGFLEKSDAIKFAAQEFVRVLQYRKGLVPIQSKLLFRDYSKLWLEFKRREGLGEAAYMRYNQEFRMRLNPFFGHLKLSEIEKAHYRNYIYELQSKDEGTSVIRYSATVLKSMIKQAEIDDLIPSKGITIVPTPRHKSVRSHVNGPK